MDIDYLYGTNEKKNDIFLWDGGSKRESEIVIKILLVKNI